MNRRAIWLAAGVVVLGGTGVTAVAVSGAADDAGAGPGERPAKAHVLAMDGKDPKKRTLPRTETQMFSLVGVSWKDSADTFEGTAQIRTRKAPTGEWTEWRDLDFDVRAPESTEGKSSGVRGASEPLWVGPSDGIEARVLADGEETAVPTALRIDMIDPGETTKGKGNGGGKGSGKGKPTASPDTSQTPVDPAPQPSESTPGTAPTDEPTTAAPSADPGDTTGGSGGETSQPPTEEPTGTPPAPEEPAPSTDPGTDPTDEPTDGPTEAPTQEPSEQPSTPPATSEAPAEPTPSTAPSEEPTDPDPTVDPSGTPEPSESSPATPTAPAAPAIVSRADWGADETLVQDPPSYLGKVDAVFVHHTAGTNNYTCTDSPAIIRAILTYHLQTNGWNDIGYNFFVDKCGTVFEGRAGGIDRPVLGAHTYGFNSYSSGISLLGDYENGGTPTPEAKQAIADVAAWKLGLHGVDPEAKVTLTAAADTGVWTKGQAATLNTISGHRDGYATLCPGASLYSALPGIRTAAGSSPYAAGN
ncbi:N-acetylmuramoyl-L-alanine amidase [Streptomyces sp. NPDC002133]|uniref:peptidoglycan recognition protein family protein n=1 Tax=Streptomyces sp. NPDC002133 TaxID=3154409 RepID=UPI003322A5B1